MLCPLAVRLFNQCELLKWVSKPGAIPRHENLQLPDSLVNDTLDISLKSLGAHSKAVTVSQLAGREEERVTCIPSMAQFRRDHCGNMVSMVSFMGTLSSTLPGLPMLLPIYSSCRMHQPTYMLHAVDKHGEGNS